MHLNNHVAVITGAASGMGRQLAIQLHAKGAAVAICDVNAKALDETKSLCYHGTGLVTTHVVDVGSRSDLGRFVEEIIAAHGRVTMLFNNAGIASIGMFQDCPEEDFDRVMAINLHGIVWLTRMILPYMKDEKQAHIVNTSSIFGVMSTAGTCAYHTSKFAVRGFTEALHQELQATMPNVSVHVVHPGGIQTDIVKNSIIPKSIEEGTPTKELLTKVPPSKLHEFFTILAMTTSEDAAKTIIDGVLGGSTRIMVGQDAINLDYLVRLFPRIYMRKYIGTGLLVLPTMMFSRVQHTLGIGNPTTIGIAALIGWYMMGKSGSKL